MKRLNVCLCLVIGLSLAGQLLSAKASTAEEVLREISWSQLEKEGKVTSEEVIPPDDQVPFECLTIENRAGNGITLTVLTVESPGITESRYAVIGEIRYEEVEGEGYLEMWNLFPDGDRYYSRTVEHRGPMKSLSGTSDWRRFVLPFNIIEGTQRPEMLIINLVLPGRGTVALSPLRLLQYGTTEDPMEIRQVQTGQWWDDRSAGFVGGIAGSVLGCLGGLIGLLASSAKARGFVLGAMKTMIALGVAALILGGVALTRSQPYLVYYPLLLIGLLSVMVPAFSLPSVRRRYEEAELRKMRAWDAT